MVFLFDHKYFTGCKLELHVRLFLKLCTSSSVPNIQRLQQNLLHCSAMDSKNPDAFVSGALAVVLQVSRLVGIAPLRFVKQRGGWRISLSPYVHVYGCVLVTVASTYFYNSSSSDGCWSSLLNIGLSQRVVEKCGRRV